MATIKTRKLPMPKALDAALTQEQRAFRRKRAQLLQRYEGQFVTLYMNSKIAGMEHFPN